MALQGLVKGCARINCLRVSALQRESAEREREELDFRTSLALPIGKIRSQTFIKPKSQGTLFSEQTIPLLSRKWTTLKGNINTQNYFLLHTLNRPEY